MPEYHAPGVISWPPSSLEIDSLVTGQPLAVKVHLANGETLTLPVDETATVEDLVEEALESQASFKKEHETETYWLFGAHRGPATSGEPATPHPGSASTTFDFPIPKDKRILKLEYQAER